MTIAIDKALLPTTFNPGPMTDQEFSALCGEHRDLQFEMTSGGELIVMAPTHSDTGASNFEFAGQLRQWARKDGRGICCDSSTGFVLPNGARRSPDASWTLKTRVAELGVNSRKSFWHLCPDFVVEVRSHTDRIKPVQEKMAEYIAQGAQLGWLLDPESHSVEIFRAAGDRELRLGINTLESDGLLAGFVVDLASVWEPLA